MRSDVSLSKSRSFCSSLSICSISHQPKLLPAFVNPFFTIYSYSSISFLLFPDTPSPQRGVEGRIRPQRRNSGGPEAQAAGPCRPLYRTTPGRGDSVGKGWSHPYDPRSTQGVEGDGEQGRVRGTRQLGHSSPRPRFGLGSATRVSPPPSPRQRRFRRWGFLQWRRRLRQHIHRRGLRWWGWARQRRAGALRPHERAVPPGTRGAGRPGRPRGRQRPRPRGCRKCTLTNSTSTNHPHTIFPLNECF